MNRYDKSYLEEIIKKCNNKSDVLRYLNLKNNGGNFKTLDKYIKLYNIDISHFNIITIFNSKNNVKISSKEDLEKAVKLAKTKLDVLNFFNLKNSGGSYKTLNKYIKLYNIDISHFNQLLFHHKIDIKNILVENSTYSSSNHLKDRLYNEGLKERKCEKCGQDENWNGERMSLILDHINGINDDNRLENLRIVCPNCNATLPTHCRGYNVLNNMKNKN